MGCSVLSSLITIAASILRDKFTYFSIFLDHLRRVPVPDLVHFNTCSFMLAEGGARWRLKSARHSELATTIAYHCDTNRRRSDMSMHLTGGDLKMTLLRTV